MSLESAEFAPLVEIVVTDRHHGVRYRFKLPSPDDMSIRFMRATRRTDTEDDKWQTWENDGPPVWVMSAAGFGVPERESLDE